MTSKRQKIQVKTAMDIVNTRVRIPTNLHNWLKQHAQDQYVSKHSLIIKYIRQAKAKNDRKKRA